MSVADLCDEALKLIREAREPPGDRKDASGNARAGGQDAIVTNDAGESEVGQDVSA